MACNKSSLSDYLKDFSGQDPLDAVICPFAGANGLGMGEAVFALFVIGGMGLGLTIRAQHPGPIVIALMLSAGLFATTLPPGALQIAAIVLLFAITAAGMILYKRTRNSL